MTTVEAHVQRLSDAMVGTPDGKPGIMELVRSSLDASRSNSHKLDSLGHQLTQHTTALDSLRLDRAKIMGAMFVIGIIWTVLALLLKYVI